jgi:DNA-binding transcriptional ArsR family regulator
MIRVEFDAASLARVRVAASPVFEVVSWLEVVASGARHPIFGEPSPRAREALRDDDVAATAAILSAAAACHYWPDFLTPKPDQAPAPAPLEAQLAAISETPVDVVLPQVPDRWWSAPVVAKRELDVTAVPSVVAAGLAKFWRAALAEDWPQVEQGLDEQVRRCGLLLATGGVAALFNSLHPSVRWSGDALYLAKPHNVTVRLHDDELVVIPSLLTLPRLTVQLDDHRAACVAFPARAPRLRRRRALDKTSLLGRGRTAVLSALRTPSTNRELAQLLRVSESTVSHHLHALARAGLAERQRRGRGVLYSLTPLGHELASSIGDD